jgi:hypothetical protein
LRRRADVPASLCAPRLPSGSPKSNDKLQKSPGQTLMAAAPTEDEGVYIECVLLGGLL